MAQSRHQCSPGRRALPAAMLMALAAAGFNVAAVHAQAASSPAAVVPQPARWVQKKLFFIYAGIQTNYVCQGLTDQVRSVLLQLGARKSDLDVHEAGCTSGFNQPTKFPAVAGTFSVLEPVAPEQAYSPSAAPGVVTAHWQPVQVQLDRPGRDVNGQCELLDQVKSHILPLFPTRNVHYESACSPREEVVGGTSLRVEVLVPDRGRQVARE
jgi:hypothetical protein